MYALVSHKNMIWFDIVAGITVWNTFCAAYRFAESVGQISFVQCSARLRYVDDDRWYCSVYFTVEREVNFEPRVQVSFVSDHIAVELDLCSVNNFWSDEWGTVHRRC